MLDGAMHGTGGSIRSCRLHPLALFGMLTTCDLGAEMDRPILFLVAHERSLLEALQSDWPAALETIARSCARRRPPRDSPH